MLYSIFGMRRGWNSRQNIQASPTTKASPKPQQFINSSWMKPNNQLPRPMIQSEDAVNSISSKNAILASNCPFVGWSRMEIRFIFACRKRKKLRAEAKFRGENRFRRVFARNSDKPSCCAREKAFWMKTFTSSHASIKRTMEREGSRLDGILRWSFSAFREEFEIIFLGLLWPFNFIRTSCLLQIY